MHVIGKENTPNRLRSFKNMGKDDVRELSNFVFITQSIWTLLKLPNRLIFVSLNAIDLWRYCQPKLFLLSLEV